MKRAAILIGFVTLLAFCASAQTVIDFSQMPMQKAPAPFPDKYPGVPALHFDNFLYVTPGGWADRGPGFHMMPTTQPNNVAFVGGKYCIPASICAASIKLELPGATSIKPNTFQPISIVLSAGWAPNNVVVTAYTNGKYVGTKTWSLTTNTAIYKFPPTWLNVTQLVFTPAPVVINTVPRASGSMVVYSFLYVQH